MQLDKAAPILAGLKTPIVIAKVNADQFTRLANRFDIEYAAMALFFCSSLTIK